MNTKYRNFYLEDFQNYKKYYIRSPFRYPGGKYYALKFIIPFLNCVPHDEYREPFVGGGSVFFAKKKVDVNWINDLDEALIETYRAIANKKRLEKLINNTSKEVASPERHSEVKKIIPDDPDTLAFQTYYLNRTSYSGIINKPTWGYKEGKSSPPSNWGNFLEKAHQKLTNTNITSCDFEEIIYAPSKNNVLIYLDPPYYHADQKRAYTKAFQLKDHYRLLDALKNTNYFFCLSYDDCPEIRQMYQWANIYERTWFYNTANSPNARKLGNELIITNYNVTQEIQGILPL